MAEIWTAVSTAVTNLLTNIGSVATTIAQTDILLIFAIPTIYFKDPSFIKWKVSIINIILAIALFICQFGFKKNIAEALTGIKNPIPENLWQRVNC